MGCKLMDYLDKITYFPAYSSLLTVGESYLMKIGVEVVIYLYCNATKYLPSTQ